MESFPKILIYGVATGVAVGVICVVALYFFFKNVLITAKPNRAVVLSGMQTKRPNGTTSGFRVVTGGGLVFRRPIIEQMETLDLNIMLVDVSVKGAYSKGGVSLDLSAIAIVAISTDPSIIDNAVERFLGQKREQIEHVAVETLEGHLRGAIAVMTPEEICGDRILFVQKIVQEASDDLNKLGLQLDSFKIKSIADSSGYIESLSMKKIAKIKKELSEAKPVKFGGDEDEFVFPGST